MIDKWLRVIVAVAVFLPFMGRIQSADGADAYVDVPISELKLVDGQLPARTVSVWQGRSERHPYACLDGAGEVYVGIPEGQNGRRSTTALRATAHLAIRTQAGADATGTLYWPRAGGTGMERVRFTVPTDRTLGEDRGAFYRLKQAHYRRLLSRRAPGAAWFRHQLREAEKAVGSPASAAQQPRTFARAGRWSDLNSTYAMFSGGRALAENLQLDRVLRPTTSDDQTIRLDTIRGVTVTELDWKSLLKPDEPERDALAGMIPFDQHALFFPSFADAVRMSDEIQRNGPPLWQLAEPESNNALTWQRYQQQLGLSLNGVARVIGPTVTGSIAVTGSDPYYRTGTDVAVLFESAKPALLEELLLAQVASAGSKVADTRDVSGSIGPFRYKGLRSPDRKICSYVAVADRLVMVTNSPAQLARIGEVLDGKTRALSELDEYTFFRQRYMRGESGETAFLVVSDATIRRWCGPRWRIATSRRTRDAAALAEVQASQMDRLARKQVESGPLYTDLPLTGAPSLRLTARGVRASTIGSLTFMTPIAEMAMERVTQDEADAYRRWRDTYQRNWRWAFDPIALRLTVQPKHLSGDLTIMPLIWGSDYRSLVDVSRGASIEPNDGDRHDTLAHFMLALNTDSRQFRRNAGILRIVSGDTPGDPLDWLGDSVEVYVEEGPIWNALAKLKPEQRNDFLISHGLKVPIAVRAEVSNGLKLTLFLAGLRSFLETAAPGMLAWETRKYREQAYVQITPTEKSRSLNEGLEKVSLYYLATGKSLVATLSEELLHRSIDREHSNDRAETKKATSKQGPGKKLSDRRKGGKGRARSGSSKGKISPAWLGKNVALHVEPRAVKAWAALMRPEYQQAMQRRAWLNLDILNEWRRRYPEFDPVNLHERLWNIRLTCPGGGKYVWNRDYQTFESTVYGCPAAPRSGPGVPEQLLSVKSGDFGLTFENRGLRARVQVSR